MKRKAVVGLLKALVLVALFAWVIHAIQWQDRVVRTAADGSVVSESIGRILGAWDGDVVVLEVEGQRQEHRLGPVAEGGAVAVSPGLWTYFRAIDKGWFALGALGYVLSMLVAAMRWDWLLRRNDIHAGFFAVWRLTWIGVFFNNVVPGQTGGDLVKAVYIVRRSPGRKMAAAMSVIVDRIMGLGSLALLGALVVLGDLSRFGALAIGIWGVLLLVCGIGVVAFSRRLRKTLGLDALLDRLPARLSAALRKVDHAVYFYRGHQRGLLLWFLLGTGNHVITIGSFFCMGEALGIQVPLIEYFVLVPIALIVSAVPIAPNGWGVGEALFGTLFGKFAAIHVSGAVPDPEAVMRTRGVALSVLYRLHTTLWSLVGGVLLLTDRQRLSRAELEAAGRDAEDSTRREIESDSPS